MKFLRILSVLFTSLLFLGFASPSFAIDGHIRITSPNGGESYKVGDTVTITWDSSPNIDKVSIGWSTGPGSLNWIAFTAPNTGSYTWNVNVGNTTNTQFVIDITGWETGSGSLSDRSDGYFTVASNAQPTAAPTNAPTTSTGTTSAPTNTSSNVNLNSQLKILPTPTPTPRPVYLSITNITIWNTFIFEGSSTTDLTKIEDPKHVENFTLDTQEGFEFVFLEELDLTDQNTLKAIANIDDYWVVETWFFWIKWEWWEVYKIDTPVEVRYKDERLTTFEPVVIDEGTIQTDSKSKPKESSFKVLGTADGELKLEIDGGAKLKIEPKVELGSGESVNTSSSSVVLTGKSSHKDLKYFVKINGKESEISPSKFDEKSGEWEMKVDGLVEGANFAELYFKDGENEKVKFGETTILFVPSFWSIWGKYILGTAAAVGLILIGIILGVYLPKFKIGKVKKTFTKLVNRVETKYINDPK